jgi:amino acid transporter
MTDSDFHDAGDRSSRLFDLRMIIGAMFVLYGVVLTVVGIFDGAAELARAGGIRINLWIGLAMLLLGLLFLLWVRLRPLRLEGRSAVAQADEPEADRTG